MKAKEVPVDLLPVHTLYLTRNNWAATTFHHWSAFRVGMVPSVPTEEELNSWKDAAADIMEELKALGVSKAQEKICNMMNSYFSFEYKKKTFRNLFEVVDMLSDDTFYSNNKDLFRDMIHMFQYGIFRSGYNGWAIDCAHEWMRRRNIVYDDTRMGKHGRQGKGFVYKLIVNRASDSLCDRLQSMTQRLYSEYIVVRDRKLKRFGNEYELQKYVFNYRFPAYLYIKKKHYVANEESQIDKDEINKIASLVGQARERGISVNAFYDAMKKYIKNNMTAGKFVIAVSNSFLLTNILLIIFSFGCMQNIFLTVTIQLWTKTLSFEKVNKINNITLLKHHFKFL